MMSFFKGTFKFLGFAWLFSVWSKGTPFRFITALKPNRFSWINALEASHSLKIIRLPLSSRRSCICCNHCSLSFGENFLVVEISPPSDSRSDVYLSWVKVFNTFATKFANFTMLVELLCQIWRGVCIFLNSALTMTSNLPYFSQSSLQAW